MLVLTDLLNVLIVLIKCYIVKCWNIEDFKKYTVGGVTYYQKTERFLYCGRVFTKLERCLYSSRRTIYTMELMISFTLFH